MVCCLSIDEGDIWHPVCLDMDLSKIGKVGIKDVAIRVDHFTPGIVLRELICFCKSKQINKERAENKSQEEELVSCFHLVSLNLMGRSCEPFDFLLE